MISHLCLIKDHFDPEEGVRGALAVPIDGPRELLKGPLDVETERFFHHPVHLLRVTMPVSLNLDKKNKERFPIQKWNTIHFCDDCPFCVITLQLNDK